MTRNLTIIFILILTLTACGQTNTSGIKGLTIDSNIKIEVEKHIENSTDFEMYQDKMQVYLNSGFVEAFENDSLTFTTKEKENKVPFKSFYLWQGDTLIIDGAFGLFGGIGFDIKIRNNEAILNHMLSSDDFPNYAYKEKDSLIFRLEVPCTETKIILSEVPDKTKKQIIYGYIEFKSENFYSSRGSAEGKEILPRQKLRNNMKLYFKSGYLDIN